jgi:hypothetical protein
MSNTATDAGEAFLKLQRKVPNIVPFYLNAAELALINAPINVDSAIAEAVAAVEAGPAAEVEFTLTGPYSWGFNDNVDIDIIIEPATGTPVVTLVTDANTVDSVTITHGSTYATAPVVTFKTATTTTALGTAVLGSDGQVVSVTITEEGVYADADLPVTVTFAAAPSISLAIPIIDGDETPDLMLRMQQTIEAASSLLYCEGVAAAGIQVSGSTITTRDGSDITIDVLALA